MDSACMGARVASRNEPNLQLNESECSETQILEQIVNINKLMKKCMCLNKKRLRDSAKDGSLNDNKDNPRKKPKNASKREEKRPTEAGEQEMQVQVLSRSYSCLQGGNASSSVTLLEIRSKTMIKGTESANSKFFETGTSIGKGAASSEHSIAEKKRGSKATADGENRSERLASRKGQWRICVTATNGEIKVPDIETREKDETSARDASLESPFELVEIYSSRREKTDPDLGSKLSNRPKDPPRNKDPKSFPNDDSSNLEAVQNFEELDLVLQKGSLKNNFAKPIQEQDLRIDVGSSENLAAAKNKEDNSEDLTRAKKVSTENTENVVDDYNLREKFEELRSLGVFNKNESETKKLELENLDEKVNNDCRATENVHILKRSKHIHDVGPVAKEEPHFGTIEEKIVDEEADEALPTIEERDSKGKYDMENLRLDLPDSGLSVGSRSSKESVKSDSSSVSKGSKSELSSIENTIDLKSKDSRFAKKNFRTNSWKGSNNMKVIIEKRESKKYYNSKQPSESGRSSTMINNNRRERGNYFHDPRKVVTKSETDSFKRENSAPDSKRIIINWDDINICKVLTRIHERLTSDWQRMKRLRTKLQSNASAYADKSIVTLQMLDKAIARCKSYIHGASDSSQAELMIGKLLSKYIIELVRTVNENKVTLENLERRVVQMRLNELHVQHVARKRSILNQIILTSNYWSSSISCSIEVISRLVKNVIAQNEEEENVKNPRKFKITQRHTFSNIPVNDTKHKSGSARSKSTKICLVKKESTVETEMSVAANIAKQSRSKILMKQSPRILEKDKHQDNLQTIAISKKVVEDSRHAEKGKSLKKIVVNANSNHGKLPIPGQKHRTSANSANSLPAWRPGGAVKISAASSVIAMNQKLRTALHAREKSFLENIKAQGSKQGISMDDIDTRKNLMNIEETSEGNLKPVPRMHDTMEEKPGRKVGQIKRKAFTETCSSKHMPNFDHDSYKIAVKRSNESVKTSPRVKSKVLKLPSKNRTESLHHTLAQAHAKNYENASLCNVADQEISKSSMAFREIEEMIKGSTDNDGDKNHKNPILCYQISADRSDPFKKLDEATLKKEELQISEEEPTRDVDTKQYKNTQLQNVDKFPEHELVEKLPEQPPFFGDAENVGISGNSDNPQLKRIPSFVGVASAKCAANLEPSADYVSKPEISSYCETPLVSPSVALQQLDDQLEDAELVIGAEVEVEAEVEIEPELEIGAEVEIVAEEEEEEDKEKETDSKVPPADHEEIKETCEDAVVPPKTENVTRQTKEIKKEKSQTNCHAASLSMLKYFLCHQGIDVDLVNKAEKYLKERQKGQKCSKKKSIRFADMSPKVESKEKILPKSKEVSTSMKTMRNVPGDSKDDAAKSSLQPPQKSKDNSTHMSLNSSSTFSQTNSDFTKSRSLQTIPENRSFPTVLQSLSTQTEVKETRNVASECDRPRKKKEGICACSITDTLVVKDSFTETSTIYHSSKSVSTDHGNYITKKPKPPTEAPPKKPPETASKGTQSESSPLTLESKFIQTSIPVNIQSTNKKVEEYRNSSKEYSQMFKKLLTQVYEGCSESLVSYGKMETESELCFDESNMSFSCNSTSSKSSKSMIHCNCNAILAHEEICCPVKGMPKEVADALRVAADKAHNVYRAIDLYKQKLRDRLCKLNKRIKCRRKSSKDCRVIKAGSRNFLRSGSVVKIFMRRTERKNKDDVVEVSKVVRQKDVPSMSSKSSFAMSDESEEEEAFESVKTSLEGNLQLRVSGKPSSTVVLGDVKSMMKLLLSDINDAATEQMESVENEPPKFSGSEKVQDRTTERGFTLFRRENLLPVVYGIVCSIVFWCLRFTIYCEVVS